MKQRHGSIEDETLADVMLWRGIPEYLRSDIEPGSPWENGYCESFNGKLRDECLNGEIFYSLREAQIVIEKWQVEYNAQRPHSALGYRPPAPGGVRAANGGSPVAYSSLRSTIRNPCSIGGCAITLSLTVVQKIGPFRTSFIGSSDVPQQVAAYVLSRPLLALFTYWRTQPFGIDCGIQILGSMDIE